MIRFRNQLEASCAMPRLLDGLARVYWIREYGQSIAPTPEDMRDMQPSAEIALGYASEPIRTTARKAVESYLVTWWNTTYPGLHIEREELALLALQVCEVYVHHLRAMPGLSVSEEEQR